MLEGEDLNPVFEGVDADRDERFARALKKSNRRRDLVRRAPELSCSQKLQHGDRVRGAFIPADFQPDNSLENGDGSEEDGRLVLL